MALNRTPLSDSDTDSNKPTTESNDGLHADADTPVADRLTEFAYEVERAERQLACDHVELHYQDKGDGEGKTAEIVACYRGDE